MLGVPVAVTAVDVDESLEGPLAADPPRLAAGIAERKALAAREAGERKRLVLAFDTVVVLDGRVLGKPADLDDARAMLRALSGRTHEVVTAVSILSPGRREPVTFTVTTEVDMRELDEAAIEEWAERGELLGCAGAYNIESHLATVGEGECFQNVAGLPLCHLWRVLASGEVRGVPEGLTPPCAACEEARGVPCPLGREVGAG